ncbi:MULTISPECIES: hypothetical protein [Nostoc]|uniref:Uncharacterized protein n=1 Tax=Nostoc paludosum FACHB-159 TaxID=2692908 RepID=A0ABR8KA07_9NOSO|nr:MULTISPECIES: hypothetical protein [Nostoc]MBD2676780.1 hypothetical protein [Nostoc sp. FACHB-857]MBD2734967.1 hypothetical protein [Nostoc paludosum FACHB-159]
MSCGKHQNEKVKACFEKVKLAFACGKYQNEKAKACFEKVKPVLEKAITAFAD